MSEFEVLLYYQFYKEDDPQKFRDEHQEFCRELGLKGRVYIAHEGINGTLAGTKEATQKYREYLRAKPQFAKIAFKTEDYDTIPFEKLKTKVRPYILNMGFQPGEDIDPNEITGEHLSPQEWQRVLDSDEDYVLLDIRNNYESEVGHFEGAICPDLDGFTDFPDWIDELEQYKDKKVLMYCTGGIRCEKFSGLMLKRGFKNINQLDGGILNYAKETGGKHFKGKCFVFDDRLVTDIQEDGEVISHCLHCGEKEYRFVNCANMECNRLFIICDDCAEKMEATCSPDCFASSKKRPFNKSEFRVPFRAKGKVFPELGRRQFSKSEKSSKEFS